MPYNNKSMPYNKRRGSSNNYMTDKNYKEEFLATPITSFKGVYYYFPKIVGVVFLCCLGDGILKRRSVIGSFFKKYGDRFSLDRSDSGKILSGIEKGRLLDLSIEKYISLKRDRNNEYDPNAIRVDVAYNSGHMDVGYIPASHSEKISNMNIKRMVPIGIEKSGMGLRVHTIMIEDGSELLKSTIVDRNPDSENNLKKFSFLSLKEIRKKMEA